MEQQEAGAVELRLTREFSGAELRLIPEFNGSPTQDVLEWLQKAELVCGLRGITRPESVIPLRLTAGAFAVYQQLSDADKNNFQRIKEALCTAFGTDSFLAYEQFVGRKLQSGESVDVFLAELRKLTVPFGGVSDRVLACAFVAGLPEAVKQLLRASSRMDTLTLEQVLARARAIISDECDVVAAANVSTRSVRSGTGAASERSAVQTASANPVCYECGLPNHFARDCFQRGRGSRAGRGRRERDVRQVRCYRCNGQGHYASSCPGNGVGERSSAPASFLNSQ